MDGKEFMQEYAQYTLQDLVLICTTLLLICFCVYIHFRFIRA